MRGDEGPGDPGATGWLRYEGRTYRVSDGRSALDVMLAEGAEVDCSCRRGVCHTCLLEAVSGDPGEEARRGLPEEVRAAGGFLPCLATAPQAVEARRPDRSRWRKEGLVAEVEPLAGEIHRVLIEPASVIDWRPGQVVSIEGPGGERRSWTVVSRPDDYFIEIHVRRREGGAVGPWLLDGGGEGGLVAFTGPEGAFHLAEDGMARPLILVGAGEALGTLTGLAKAALDAGQAPVTLLAALAPEEAALLETEREALAAREGLTLRVVTAPDPAEEAARLFAESPADLSGHGVLAAGDPDLVERVRIEAHARGAGEALRTLPFDPPEPYRPHDDEKMAAMLPDAELWAALDEGPRLTRILQDFYAEVFEDERLRPFFLRVTRQRLVEKQYAFLAEVLTGKRSYFGERPFNAHHWMIISDDLFDYREEMFFRHARNHGVPEPLIRRWRAIDEAFRREIVKDHVRGQWLDGEEYLRESFVDETAPMDLVCDRCGSEVREGTPVRTHQRTGELYCAACAGLSAREGEETP